MIRAVQLSRQEALLLLAGHFLYPQGTAGRVQKEAAMLNRSKHVFALTFFLGQKELLKSSDKKHFSPLEKTMVAYAATSVPVQGIPSVFLAFKRILNYSNILQKNNNETDNIGKTKLFSSHHSIENSSQFDVPNLPHFAAADHRRASQCSLSTHL